MKQNVVAANWKLTAEQIAKLDRASQMSAASPCWRQTKFSERNFSNERLVKAPMFSGDEPSILIRFAIGGRLVDPIDQIFV